MKKKEIRSAVKTVYQELWDLLFLLEKEEGRNFNDRKIDKIKGHVSALFLGEEKIRRSLNQIVEETQYFIGNCEVPGVVTRWKRINPRLVYFDCAFEVMETCPEAYLEMRRGLTNTHLSCYPDVELIEKRNAYFANAKAKSEEQIFKEEILHTLTLLFEDAFQEYL